MIVVSNTSPITNLAAIDHLLLLQQLYGAIVIPQAVYNEITGVGKPVAGSIEVQTLAWIQTQHVANNALVTALQLELDQGEAEAIVLAVDLRSYAVECHAERSEASQRFFATAQNDITASNCVSPGSKSRLAVAR